MFKFVTRCALPLLSGSVALFGTSCSSTPTSFQEKVAEAGNWIDNPGDIRDTLAAVGAARVMGNISSARNRAEIDARQKMAATARAKVQSLLSNWFKETGDMLDERTMSSYMNDEGIMRQLTDTEIIGARAAKYEVRDNTQYVLMVIDDPAKWTQQVGSSLKDKVLRDETMFKTEVMKRDFEEKLDKLINRDAEAATEAQQKFEKNYVK
ncbi:MAG: hypothetical protein R3F56_05145 [Planctomycetota bacterium]